MQVVVEHLHEARLVARLFENGFQAQERVAVARNEFQNLCGIDGSARQVVELLHVDDDQSAQNADLLGVASGRFQLIAEQRRQSGPAFAFFVRLDDVAQCHRFARIDREDLQIDLGGIFRARELLGVKARQAVQNVDLFFLARCSLGFVDEKRDHLIPLLGLLQDALLCFAGSLVAWLQLPDAAPHGERAVRVTHLGLGDDGDFLEPRQQFLDRKALLEIVFGRELKQVGQLAVGSARAEVLGVGLERLHVARIHFQDSVQVHSGLLAVAQAIVVERGQLAQQRQARFCFAGALELLFA